MRRYQGLGKFDGCLLIDILAYRLAADSYEIHSAEYLGSSASFVDGPFDQTSFSEEDEVEDESPTLTEEELTFLRQQSAAIVYENSQGFVSVEWFEFPIEAREHFDSIESNYYGDDLDAGEDEPDEHHA